MQYHHIAITLFLAFSLANCSPDTKMCKWKDHLGNNYDWSSLYRPQSWSVEVNEESGLFGLKYFFNFCGNIAQKCKGKQVGAIESLLVMGQITDTCEILGQNTAQNVKLADPQNPSKGLHIEYLQGGVCEESENKMENGKPRKVVFQLECAGSQDAQFVKVLPNG